jgi:hypothetical protein
MAEASGAVIRRRDGCEGPTRVQVAIALRDIVEGDHTLRIMKDQAGRLRRDGAGGVLLVMAAALRALFAGWRWPSRGSQSPGRCRGG